ncbi:MAG: tetratricopeptide repeat protein [Myxococcales bacterium]|nr:MAG: tetratricopeptide repeat protein [Myxococcales bacterium]
MPAKARERIERMLGDAIGLDPRSIGRAVFERALATRVRATRARAPASYARLLEGSREELAALIEEVVVSETWFFRDAPALHFLAGRFVEPGRIAAVAGAKVRILSMACATGEEPYSVVMALLDAGLPPEQIHVRAIDVSSRAIEQARRGSFGPNSFRSTQLDFRDRFFRRKGVAYQIDSRIQSCVDFDVASALDPKLSLGTGCFDAILCRNLLIYLDPPSRAKVVSRLENALAADGVLLTGHAEALPVVGAHFARAPGAPSFAYVHAKQELAGDGAHPVSRRESDPSPRSAARRKDASRRRPAKSQPRAAPAESVIGPTSLPPCEDALREAQAACTHAIARGEVDGDVYCLLGVALRAQGRLAEAEACFERALYLDRNHYQALVHLALLREANGDLGAAALLRRRAARAASAGAPP